jgi:hypothetical protein
MDLIKLRPLGCKAGYADRPYLISTVADLQGIGSNKRRLEHVFYPYRRHYLAAGSKAPYSDSLAALKAGFMR